MSRHTQLSLATAVLLATTGCSSSGNDLTSETAPQARCAPYPSHVVAGLLAAVATPAPGSPGEAVTVETTLPDYPEGDLMYIVAFELNGKAVVLAHPVEAGQAVTDSPTYYSLSAYTEQVTAQPRNDEIESRLNGQTVSAAIDCLDETP